MMTAIVVPPDAKRCAFCEKRHTTGPFIWVQCTCGKPHVKACGACVTALLESKSSRATFDSWLMTWATRHSKCRGRGR